MAVRLGLDARLYRHDGADWTNVANVRDLTLSLETGEADVTTRGNAGWRATVGTLKDASIEFEMVWDTDDEDFVAIRDAFLINSVIKFLVMDGNRTDEGSQGLEALCRIMNFSRSEPLEEAISVSVTAKPTYTTTPPVWRTGPIE
jgi:predicted secreted protein